MKWSATSTRQTAHTAMDELWWHKNTTTTRMPQSARVSSGKIFERQAFNKHGTKMENNINSFYVKQASLHQSHLLPATVSLSPSVSKSTIIRLMDRTQSHWVRCPCLDEETKEKNTGKYFFSVSSFRIRDFQVKFRLYIIEKLYRWNQMRS